MWSPRGEALGYAWRTERAGDRLASVMSGLRYVRNRVHHQWADAMIEQEPNPSESGPIWIDIWGWRPINELPSPSGGREDPDGRAAYRDFLEGEAVEDALVSFAKSLVFLASELDPTSTDVTTPVLGDAIENMDRATVAASRPPRHPSIARAMSLIRRHRRRSSRSWKPKWR